MELYRTLFCTMVYHHRHSKFFGHNDMPVFTTFVMIACNLLFILWGSMFVASAVGIIEIGMAGKVICSIVPIIVSLSIYWKLCCGKRYIGSLKNPKYYTKKRFIFSWCFQTICFAYCILSMWVFFYVSIHSTRQF